MRLQRFFPTFDNTCALLLPALIAFRVLITAISPHDFWWHMAEGRTIVAQRAVPLTDSFSWTRPGAPYYDQSWLSQVIMYVLHALGGLPLIILAQAFVVAGAYALLLWFSIRYSKNARLSALLLVAVMLVSFDNWLVRPQSYVLPVFIGFFVLLNGYRLGWWRCLWPLPLLMALWANLHGSFPLGMVLIALTLVGEGFKLWKRKPDATESPAPQFSVAQWNRLAFYGVLCAVATLLNPRGYHLYEYVQMMFASPSNRFSGEWLSPSLRSFNDAMFFVFAAGVVIVLFRARRSLDPTEIVTLLVFTTLALSSGRYIIWFAIVATVPLSRAIIEKTYQGESRPQEDGNAFNLVIVATVWLMLLPVLPWFKAALELPPPLDSLLAPETPVQAVTALKKLPPSQRPQRLFHNEASGSYLTWAAPEQKVYTDTRFEFYPPQQWRDTLSLRDGRNIESLIQKYRFDGMLLDNRQHRALLRYVENNPRWRMIHRDRIFTVYVVRAAPKPNPTGVKPTDRSL